MASIGDGWEDGAWIQASWITGAWAVAVAALAAAVGNMYRGLFGGPGKMGGQ